MNRVEYNFNENKIGLSIKRPSGVRKKWSESYVTLNCEECGSTNLRSAKTGEVFMVACMECPNFNWGNIEYVARWDKYEEAVAYPPNCFELVR